MYRAAVDRRDWNLPLRNPDLRFHQTFGTAALMFQANPSLTPNLVKAILMYTAQPLAGMNTLEQGAGEINADGALRLAQEVRTDLSPSTPLGAELLTGAAPTGQSTIAGSSFSWARGIILNHGYATIRISSRSISESMGVDCSWAMV
jgi:hypothetical protein